MKRLLAASTLVAALPTVAAGHDRDHVPGCQTKACDKRIGRKWARKHKQPPAHTATASWYGPGFYGHTLGCAGQGGVPAGATLQPGTVGVAHKTLPCGTRVKLCVRRCLTAPVVDRGPYVAGRTFDLTAPVRQAIGAASIATVRFTVVG